MTSNIAQQLYEQFQAIEAKFTGKQAEPYAFHEGEPWNTTLAKLPRTCRLWKQFLRFDIARARYEQHTGRRNAWQQQRRMIGQRLEEVDLTALDPATSNLDALALDEAKFHLLERILNADLLVYQELKGVTDREGDAWGSAWENYVHLLHEEQRILKSDAGRPFDSFDANNGLVNDVQQRRKRLEAA